MITNLNSEEKNWWDREMEKYRRRQKRKNWSLQNFLYWFTVTICLIIIFGTCRIRIGPETPTPEQQMEDTISTSRKEEIKALNPKAIILAHPIQEDSL